MKYKLTVTRKQLELIEKITQEFEIRHILTKYYGQKITDDLIFEITSDILTAITSGPCSWAFKTNAKKGEIPCQKKSS